MCEGTQSQPFSVQEMPCVFATLMPGQVATDVSVKIQTTKKLKVPSLVYTAVGLPHK